MAGPSSNQPQNLPASAYLRTVGTLILRTIAHRFRKISGLAARPLSLTITITRRCNSRCIMCNIWRLEKRREELPLHEIIKFLDDQRFSKLVELDLTGGEPFLRQELPELIRYVSSRKGSTLANLKTVALASNGLLPGKVVGVIAEILAAIQGKFDLAMVCSLDGFGESHDQVRGISGAYKKVRETIKRLQQIQQCNANFWLGIKTTILPVNWEQVPQLIQFAQEQGLFHILSPVLFTEERFRNLASRNTLDVLESHRNNLIQLYSQENLRDSYYSFVVQDTLRRGNRRVPCTAASDHFFIEGDGTIYGCPLLNLPLGRIQTHSIEDILASPFRQKVARKVGCFPSCNVCLEPGCIRFSQSSDALSFLRFLHADNISLRFRTAFFQEGLSKYL
jgi:MoaA/NifB/PqqE/SkfB family radical SAM enzyme